MPTADQDAVTSEISVEQLLAEDMTSKVIVSITLSTLDETKYIYKSYKVQFVVTDSKLPCISPTWIMFSFLDTLAIYVCMHKS